MGKQTIAYLKSKFESGDKPTQQDFWDIFDTFLTLDEAAQSYISQAVLENYLTITDANNEYLKKIDASNTYLTKASASSTYLTQTTAVRTYLKQEKSVTVTKTQQKTVQFEIANNWGHVHVMEQNSDGTFVDITGKCVVKYLLQNMVSVSRVDEEDFKLNTYLFG